MNTLDAIKSRRAIKHYDPTFKISEKDLDYLLEHMLESPTSFNLQHWRFVLIDDKNLRKQIREAAWGQEQVTDASLLFILCADTKAWEKSPEQYWKDSPIETKEMMVPMIKDFYQDKEQLQRDEALRSVGIAAQTTMLAAKAMAYDSCPMIGFDHQKVAELIKLPHDHIIGMMLVIGKATKPAWPKSGQLTIDEVLVRNKFDT
ncbi:MAG: nitroreductase family protein [Cellvibrionaceae bacterium]